MSEQKLYVVRAKGKVTNQENSPYCAYYLSVNYPHLRWVVAPLQATKFTEEEAEGSLKFLAAIAEDKSLIYNVEKVEPRYAIARDCANGVRVFFTGIWESDHHLEDAIQWNSKLDFNTPTFDHDTAVKYQEALKTLCGLDTRLVF